MSYPTASASAGPTRSSTNLAEHDACAAARPVRARSPPSHWRASARRYPSPTRRRRDLATPRDLQPGAERLRTELTYDVTGEIVRTTHIALDGSAATTTVCQDVAPGDRVRETESAEGIRTRYGLQAATRLVYDDRVRLYQTEVTQLARRK